MNNTILNTFSNNLKNTIFSCFYFTQRFVNVGAVGVGSSISSLAGRPCDSSSRIFSNPSGC